MCAQYAWLDEMFKEMATFVFFVMTGYKFRPASNNPYFVVSTEDDMNEVTNKTRIRIMLIQLHKISVPGPCLFGWC